MVDGEVRRDGGGARIDGLEAFPAWMTLAGGLVACSRYLGFEHSPAWVYGGSGFAFALNVHRGLCPSGPTAWREERCMALARNLGLDVEGLVAFRGEPQWAEKRAASFARVREAIDAGLPVIGWEMAIPEFYLVYGYDGDGNYLFLDLGGGTGSVHHGQVGESQIGVHWMMVVRPVELAGDDLTVRQALQFAVEVGAGGHGLGGEYATGLDGYDQWIAALERGEELALDEDAGFGLGYNAACWAECRHYTVPFLEEAAAGLGGGGLGASLATALACYRKVADGLGEVHHVFPFDADEGGAMQDRLGDAARRERAVEALRAARDAEAEGLRALGRTADALGAGGSGS